MKISLLYDNCVPKIKIDVSDKERGEFNKFLERIGCSVRHSYNIWGRGIEGDFYSDVENNLGERIAGSVGELVSSNEIAIINDVNHELISSVDGILRINIAFFRLFVNTNSIEIPIDKFLNVTEFKKFILVAKKVLEFVFNTILEKEVELQLQLSEK